MESFFTSTPFLIAVAVVVTALLVIAAVYLYEKRTSKSISTDITDDLESAKVDALTELTKAHTALTGFYASALAEVDKLKSATGTAVSTAAAAASSAAVSAAVTSIEQSVAAHSTTVAAALATLKPAVSEGTKA
jgi:hypothetical protein